MRKALKMRIISLAMCLVLVVGCLPMNVLADGLMEEPIATEVVDETSEETLGELPEETTGETPEETTGESLDEGLSEEATEEVTEVATEEASEETPETQEEPPVVFAEDSENLALGKKVTVSGNEAGAAASPEEAVDGSVDTRWSAGPAMKNVGDTNVANQTPDVEWIVVDLGATCVIDKVIVKAPSVKAWGTKYAIQVSADGKEFTTVKECVWPAEDKGSVVQENTLDTPAEAQYVKVLFHEMNTYAKGATSVSIAELEIMGSVGEIEPWNLALNRPASASSNELAHTVPENAFDGDAAQTSTSWGSGDMKAAGTVPDDTVQTPQWIQVDLGASESTVDHILVTYGGKVWPMEYMIQTSSDAGKTDAWQDVCTVKRPSAFNTVTNGEGQNIADTAANTDTITAESNPALTSAQVERYVRFYFVKTNAQAPGKNVNIKEIEIWGTSKQDPVLPPLNLRTEMAKITSIPNPNAGDTALALPEVDERATLSVVGSEVPQVISDDGVIYCTNIGERTFEVMLQLTENENPENYERKNFVITVPDNSGSTAYTGKNLFPAVANPNGRPGIVPSVQEWYGYEGNFTLTAGAKIVYNNNGTGLDLRKAAENMKADLKEICGFDLAIVEGAAPAKGDIYIEAQPEDTFGTGKEGYLLVTDNNGIRIYSSAYIGALYGTISVEQMLWLSEDNTVPMGVIRDFPLYEVRGFMPDIARTPYRLDMMYDISKIMLWYKMNELHTHLSDSHSMLNRAPDEEALKYCKGFHRIESDRFPSLISEMKPAGVWDLTKENYYRQLYKMPHYTKEEWKDFQKYSASLGVNILNELDMPSHSTGYIKYAMNNPDNIPELNGGIGNPREIDCMALIGENKERALWFSNQLWDEYTEGEDPVFQGDVVHIGADEYWDKSATGTDFFNFIDTFRQTVQDNGKKKVRLFASFGAMKVPNELLLEHADDYQIDMFISSADSPKVRAAQGFEIVNGAYTHLYGNPGHDTRDIIHPEHTYNDWDPTIFDNGKQLEKGEPKLLGAKTLLWGDGSQEGMTEKDVEQRILRAVAVTGEKTWGGTQKNVSFQEYELRANKLAEGPGTDLAMKIDTKSSLVADYDFANVSVDGKTVYDASGNGYNAALNGGKVQDGFLTFDGVTEMKTNLKSLSYPFTVSFDVKLSADDIAANAVTYGDEDAANDANLFSGYDGRIQPAGYKGNFSADVVYFTRDFKYQIPADKTVNLTLVGTMHGTKLYVDGKMVTFLSQEKNEAVPPTSQVGSMQSSLILPLEEIGENFHGSLANIKIYNKAMSPEQIFGQTGKVDVAQDTIATSQTGYQAVNFDKPECRMTYAEKAIDGDGFNKLYTGTGLTSERSSYWKAFKQGSFLLVDMGKEREVSEFEIQWVRGGIGKNFTVQTSMDGKNFTDVQAVTGNTEEVTTITLATPVNARYVKLVCNTSNTGNTFMIQEFMVNEIVDKTELKGIIGIGEGFLGDVNFNNVTADKKELFDAVTYAKAMLESPLATVEDVKAAIDRIGVSIASEDTGAPTTPADFKAEATVNGTNLTWSASKDDVGVLGYKIYLDGEYLTTTAECEYSITGLAQGSEHKVYVVAFDLSQKESAPTEELTFTVKEDVTAPGKPEVTVETLKTLYADIKWEPVTDDVAVAGYEVSLDGKVLDTIEECEYTVKDLRPNHKYTISVVAIDTAGNRSEAGTVTVEPPFMNLKEYEEYMGGNILAGATGESDTGYYEAYPIEKMFDDNDNDPSRWATSGSGDVIIAVITLQRESTFNDFYMCEPKSGSPILRNRIEAATLEYLNEDGEWITCVEKEPFVNAEVHKRLDTPVTTGKVRLTLYKKQGAQDPTPSTMRLTYVRDVELVATADKAAVKVGETAQVLTVNDKEMLANLLPDARFTSGDETIATVDETGKITGVALGETTITVAVTVNGKEYTCTLPITVADEVGPKLYKITVGELVGGKLSPLKTEAKEGESVTVRYIPDPGYTFKYGSMKYNGISFAGNSFKMPAEDVVLTAEFTKNVYNVIVFQADGGKIAVDKTKASIGDIITVTVTPDEGYQFVEGSLTVDGKAIEGNTFVMPAANVKVTAKFEKAAVETEHKITVEELVGGSVTPDKTTAKAGETVNLTVKIDLGYRLDATSLKYNGIIIPTWKNSFVMPDEDVVITAKFVKSMYKITIEETVGGTVTADKALAGIDDIVTLTVTPAEGYKLVEGSLKVNGKAIEGTTFKMPAEAVTVTAEFEKIEEPTDPTDPTEPEEKPGKPSEGHKHDGSEGAWVSDEEAHWHVCECGDIIDKEAHTPGKDGVCTGCGKVLFTPNGSADGSTQSPNTGDTMNALPLVALLGVVLASVAVVRRRKIVK